MAWATSPFSPPIKLFHADPSVVVWLFTWAFPGTCEAYLPSSRRERIGEKAISWMSFGVALKYGEYEVCLQSEFPGHLSLELGALSVSLFMGEWNTCPKTNESWDGRKWGLCLALSSRALSWEWGRCK